MAEASYPRDLHGYGRSPPDPGWPGGARIAVQFVVNFEEGGENNILHGDTRAAGPARIGRVAAVAMEIAGVSGFSHLRGLEADSLRTLPQHGLAQLGQILQA